MISGSEEEDDSINIGKTDNVQGEISLDNDDEDETFSTEENNDTKSNHNEDEDEDNAESQYKLARCISAIRKYLTERLSQVQTALTITSYVNPYTIRNGHAESSNFHDSWWKVEVTRRAGGLATGLLDFTYVHTAKDGKKTKLRGRAEALTFIGLLPSFKTIKNMTKDHCYINAEENRERHILSQLLSVHGFACDEISYDNGVMTIKKGSETYCSGLPVFDMLSATSPLVAAPVSSYDAFFAYGTSIILQWGTIVTDNPAFHTNCQLFPLGFRCIRMEQDVSLDRVVDCLCEVDGVYEISESERSYYSTLLAAAKDDAERAALSTHDLVPLFRITVSWQIGAEPVAMIRVYEARSPQQAWQAAMLESLGLSATLKGLTTNDQTLSLLSDADEIAVDDFEEPDAEEFRLRTQIREQRRSYFRALRTEQSLGLQAAVKPRLALEAVDTFAEDLVMRLIEGLPGSTLCANYIFTDLRDPLQAGRKNMMKYYTKAYMKAKALDKRIKNIRGPETQAKPSNEASDVDSELTAARIHMQRVRMGRIREIEKNLGLLRISLGKMTKKRREDAKAYTESICEIEESKMGSIAAQAENTFYSNLSPAVVRAKADTGDLKCQQIITREMLQRYFSSSRPEPSSCTLHHCGNVVGYILEVWEYLNAFAKAFKIESIPSIDQLLAAVKVCDPTYRKLEELGLGFTHTLDGVEASEFWPDEKQMPTIEEAEDILNEIGINLCGPLLKDFERIMGIDAIEAQIGQHRIPINSLTWKEIARVVLIETTSKLVGMNDIDIVGMIKGKGYATVPDAPDRKTMKLSRRRITFSYNIRNEVQESLYKFESGVCIRIPSPCNPVSIPKMLTDFWDPILSLLQDISERNIWLVFKALKVAAAAVTVLDKSLKARRLKRSFKRFIKACSLTFRGIDEPTKALLSDLNAYGSSLERRNFAERVSIHNWPSSAFELWIKQVHEAVRYARSSNPAVDRGDGVRSGSNSPKHFQGEAVTNGDDAEMEIELESKSIPTVPPTSVPLESAHEEVPPTEDTQLQVDDDADEAEKLSVAMQRCYIVIRDLMNFSHSNMFINPVSSEVVTSYYKSVDQPTSLSEIRRFLVDGGYENSIYRFYMDVRFLIENAVCFNPEGTIIRASAQKLLIIFERLFLETVLAWDSPHLYCDYCVTCKSLEHASGCKMAICDRCEAPYHLDCLDPPLSIPPRDWYCLMCVEQIGLASVHPFKTASVRHPDDPTRIGEVVGIEQPKQTLMFIVSFNGDREMWSGKKVRNYAVKPESASSSPERNNNTADLLPSGYDIDDYDKVCGLARGYAGWGESHYLIPSVFMDAHSIFASNIGKTSSVFNSNRLSIAALTMSGKSISIECCNSMREWAMILYALQQRALSSPALSYILSQIEEGVDENLIIQLMEEIRAGCLSSKTRDLIAADHHASAVQFSSQPLKGSARIKKESAPLSIISPSTRPLVATTAEQAADPVDSDDDEYYDAEGNCLTSYFPTSSVPNEAQPSSVQMVSTATAESEEEWELRFLSRQKGREDALFTQVLIADMVAQVQLFNNLEQEQMKMNDTKLDIDIDFYDVAMQMLSKLCMAKPSETLLPDEWSRGWENTMNVASLQPDAESTDTAVCGFCSMSESYLLSPFVKAQTLDEWFHDACSSDAEHTVIGEGSHGNLSHATVTSSTGIKGFRSTNKLMKGITWEPLNEGGSNLETEECKKAHHRTMRAGSLIMHECCANYMHVYRQIAFDKFKQAEELYVVEILLGLGRARSTSIGRDRENSLYWIFSGSNYLFVSQSHSSRSIAEFSRKAAPQLNTESVEKSEDSSRWSIYRTMEEIGLVILWLSKEIPSERMLLKVLVLLYPNAATEGLKYLTKLDEEKSSAVGAAEDTLSPEVSDSENEIQMDVEPGVKVEPVSSCGEQKNDVGEMVDTNNTIVDSNGVHNHVPDANAMNGHEEEDEFDDESTKVPLKRQRLTNSADDEIGASSTLANEDLGRSRRTKRPKVAYDDYCPRPIVAKDVHFKQGDQVVVKSSSNGILWEGQVLETKYVEGVKGSKEYYYIGFSGWSSAYNGWFSDSAIFPSGSRADEQLAKNSRLEHLRNNVLEAPETLKSLHAFKHIHESYRHWGLFAPTLTFGNSRSTVGMLRAGLLIVEAALPAGSVDDAEDKWGDDLVVAWRESVNIAQDATALMQSQIVLECAVKNAWLRPAGLKLMCCLPSRAHAMRNATCGAVAVRLWALDSAIRYDKVQIEQFVEPIQKPKIVSTVPKGRPPKSDTSVPIKSKRQQHQAVVVDEAPSETASVASSTILPPTKPTSRGGGRRR
eukprot:gene23401-31743_t